MAKVITTAAIKGGTGKTATAGAISQAAAAAGKKVLAIDLDPQCSLSIWFNANLQRPGSYEIITKGTDPAEAMQETESGAQIICGKANLTAVKTGPGSARRLEAAIAPYLPAFDLIMIDTAPAMGELQNNALYASDGLLIPLETDSASLQGFYQIMDISKHIQESKPALQVIGVIITKYDPRPKINRLMQETIKEKAAEAGIPYLGEIRQGVAIREAMALQTDLYEYAPKSRPAADYQKVYNLIAGNITESTKGN